MPCYRSAGCARKLTTCHSNNSRFSMLQACGNIQVTCDMYRIILALSPSHVTPHTFSTTMYPSTLPSTHTWCPCAWCPVSASAWDRWALPRGCTWHCRGQDQLVHCPPWSQRSSGTGWVYSPPPTCSWCHLQGWGEKNRYEQGLISHICHNIRIQYTS